LSKKTLKVVKDQKELGNECILQVKKNQKKLLRNCKKITKSYIPCDIGSTKDKAHGRIEIRSAKVFPFELLTSSVNKEWKKHIQTLIRVKRVRKKPDYKNGTWKESEEISFYISTIPLSAKDSLHVIRSHWGIENSNHHVRDVSLEEDKSRIRKNPNIMVKIRSFALNLMKANKVDNIKNESLKNAYNINHLLNYQYL